MEIATPFAVIVTSAVNVHVFVDESQVPTVEQSPPSFALRVIPDVVTVPLGALAVSG